MRDAPPPSGDGVARLIACGPLKVWSVLVTVLGDLSAHPGDRFSGKVLTRLIAPLGLSGPAMRVALHRLRRDGWIVSNRQGRESLYGLSPEGWHQTERVRPRIYAAEIVPVRSAQLVVGPPAQTMQDFAQTLPSGAIPIAPRAALLPAEMAPGSILSPNCSAMACCV